MAALTSASVNKAETGLGKGVEGDVLNEAAQQTLAVLWRGGIGVPECWDILSQLLDAIELLCGERRGRRRLE